jgi:hypothetical protein
LTAANVNETTMLEKIDAITPIRRPEGRPRKRPAKLHGDKVFRRPKVRHERGADIHEAFLKLGCALICLNFIQRWFC